ncbi:hypothetical protein HOC35_05470 [Candidatus Woesearchaeota archaeon]|jgi:hypothetical protein|nr:hypothetical protein [Candidatus Woesearchaeota archaeon]
MIKKLSESLNDYGFLTDFNISPITARERVRKLFEFGIRHFQFYDAMDRYEIPIIPNKKEWNDPIGRTIRRETIDAYVDEIRKVGGISWFYTGIYSVSPGFVMPGLEKALFSFLEDKQHYAQEWICLDDNPDWAFVSIIDPSTEEWKQHYTEQLRTITEDVGFTGIYFDQYGSLDTRWRFRYKPDIWSFDNIHDHDCFEEVNKAELMADFLRYFRQEMPDVGVIFNAADGYAFDETKDIVDFPYIELWNDNSIEHYCSRLKNTGKFVIVAYSSSDGKTFDREMFLRRKKIINDAGGDLLFRGDDNRYLVNCYFPSAIRLN